MNLFNIKNSNKKFYAILLSTVTFVLLVLSPAAALDLSVGANTWYSYWKVDAPENFMMTYDPGWLYGPLLSARFADDWSISSVFLYGRFTADRFITEIIRYDSDTLLNYTINDYFKIFAGFKYFGFEWENVDGPGGGTHRGMGPGLGIALTVPLYERVYFLLNASGLYIKGKEKANSADYSYNVDVLEKAINSTASIAYYFPSASTSVAVGYRYQYVKMDYQDELETTADQNITYHGATLSAVYSFSI